MRRFAPWRGAHQERDIRGNLDANDLLLALVADSDGNLVAFQRMDGAMLASIQIAEHKARAAVTFRRPTKIFEDGVQLMHLNYLLAFDGIIASRGGIPLIDQGMIIGAIGCSGGTDSQDEVVSKAGAAVINNLPAGIK